MIKIFKSRKNEEGKTKISNGRIAECVAIMEAAAREITWFEIDNACQQQIRDYLAEQLMDNSKKLLREWVD